jgi:Tfp pilus assembly PilM family ATPase
MQYWHTKEGNRGNERRIKKIILCGGSVNLKGLPEYMTESLNVTCIRGNVWENAFRPDVTIPPIERNFSYGYATAIGLALNNVV